MKNRIYILSFIISMSFWGINSYGQEDTSKTFLGSDVDTTQINKPNWGIQVANDFSFMSFPSLGRSFTMHENLLLDGSTNYDDLNPEFINKKYGTSEYLAKKLGYNSMFYQRADLWLGVALPYRTNIYTMISFRILNQDSGVQSDFSYTLLNLELEHFFNNNIKIRLGRLINKLSVSQFYGRIALGSKDAHMFGRTPFVDDAIELDLNYSDKGLPVFILGAKPLYNKFELGSLYGAAHYKIAKNVQTYFVASVNKTKGSDIVSYLPDYNNDNGCNDRWFSAFEYELAYKSKKMSAFANVGALANYIGATPHVSGARDILKKNEPWTINKKDAFNNTFTTSVGLSLRPSSLCEKLHFFNNVGIEAEAIGLASDQYTVLSGYFFAKFKIAKNFFIDYSCNPQFVEFGSDKYLKAQNVVVAHTDRLKVCAHYLRLSVIFGKPLRLM